MSWQSSLNIVSNHLLNVSCGVLPSSEFMTAQILSSLELFGTDDRRPFVRVLISAMRVLISAIVSIQELRGGDFERTKSRLSLLSCRDHNQVFI